MGNPHTVYLFVIFILFAFAFFQRRYYVAKLKKQKPVLNFEMFETVVNDHLKAYGEDLSEVIVRTCLATAHALGADVTIHEEMHEEMDECEAYVKRTRPRIAKADADFKRDVAEADADFKREITNLQKAHDDRVRMFKANIDSDNARIKEIRGLHRLI